jgi:predicted  nucleic acid-binding Zn-ribbon protein
VTEEIQILWALHGLDERAVAKREALKAFAGRRAEVERGMVGAKARLETVKARIAEIQKRRREREQLVETKLTEERKFQSQLPAVKKNEEYQALLHEIAAVKAKRSEIETDVLVALDEEESAMAEKGPAEKALADAEAHARESNASVDRDEAAARAELDALGAERQALIVKLPPATRSRYERIHASREGRAVVAIAKNACGGCYRNQPPQMIQEAKRGDRALFCDGCGRMMVWPPGVP